MDTSLNIMVVYIKHHINDLSVSDRHDVLQMLINSRINDKKIQTKGGGTQIKFRDIPIHIIKAIYNYVRSRVDVKLNELQNFPNGDTVEV